MRLWFTGVAAGAAMVLACVGLGGPASAVVGGSQAPEGAYPYLVSVRAWGSHSCGGAILNARWILTTARCVDSHSPAAMTVVAGTNTLNTGGATYKVASMVPHPDFDSWTIANDIGLLQLAEPIAFGDPVKPVPLGEDQLPDGTRLAFAGWGTTSSPGSTPNDLQHITLTTISQQACSAAYTEDPAISGANLCTFTRAGEGMCHGDSGGPLVAGGRVYGISSWGRPCAKGLPDVNTRVSSHTAWIRQHIG